MITGNMKLSDSLFVLADNWNINIRVGEYGDSTAVKREDLPALLNFLRMIQGKEIPVVEN